MAVVNTIILYFMMTFMVIGGLGRILKQWSELEDKFDNLRWKSFFKVLIETGNQFENGFMSMGPLGLAMVGVIALAPVLANVMGPLIIPLYKALGASPAMFSTTLLANDMGGFYLAKDLATVDGVTDNAAWLYAGLILGSMMGVTLVFSIPVAVGLIYKKDHRFLALGVMAGLITIPIGCVAGGLVAKYSHVMINGQPVVFTFQMIFQNLIPVVMVSVLIALGLWGFPERMIQGFQIFAKIIVTIITIGLVLAVLKSVLGLEIIPGMDPIFMIPGDKPGELLRAMEVIGYIACILLGAYPMVYLLTLWFEKPLLRIGKMLDMNNFAAAGMVASLANNIPMFSMLHKMDDRGKVLNVAFTVSAAFTFGDHLGFTAANVPGMIFAVIVGKIVGGISAIFVAMLIAPKTQHKDLKP